MIFDILVKGKKIVLVDDFFLMGGLLFVLKEFLEECGVEVVGVVMCGCIIYDFEIKLFGC